MDVGGVATGEPVGRTEPRRRRFSLLADQGDAEFGTARVRRRLQPFSPLADQDDAEFGAAPVRPRRFSPAADEDDPFERGTPAYYARLQAMLDAPIQGIAPGIGSLSPEGRPALPTWVQQRLDEQERAEAAREAAAAKRAADLRAARQPEPRRRLFSPLADQDDAELGAARVRPRSFSPIADQDDAELGAARLRRRRQRFGPIADQDDAELGATPVRPRSFSPIADQDDAELGAAQGREPRRRLFDLLANQDDAELGAAQGREPRRRLFDLLANQDDAELGAARGRVPAPVTPTPEPRPPRPFSPLADQDDAELGAARLRRRRQPFSPLADQDDAELGAASVRPRSFSPLADQDEADLGAAPVRPRQFGPPADQDDADFGAATNLTSGPGAWMFPLTEGEEVTLTPSLEGYIPERVIEYHKRVQRGETDPIGAALAAQYSEDANQKAWWIAYYETPWLSDQSPRADALRAGAPLTEYSGDDLEVWGQAAVTAGIDAGRWVVENPDDAAELVWDTAKFVDEVPRTPTELLSTLYDAYGPEVGFSGEALSALMLSSSECSKPRPGVGGMIIYEDCKGLVTKFIKNKNPGSAITLGDTVFAIGTIDLLTELEEYYHFLDWQENKDFFPFQYSLYQGLVGYDNNPFETEAQARACVDYERIKGRDQIWRDGGCANMIPPSGVLDHARLYGLDPILDFPGVQADRARRGRNAIWGFVKDRFD